MLPFQLPQTRFDLKFRLLGVAARVHPSFWLLALLFAGPEMRFSEFLIGSVLLFLSISVHEMGHALSGKHYGDRSPSILLYGMGGLYFPGSTNLRRGRAIWMLVWGPLAGFLLGAIFAVIALGTSRGWIPRHELLEFAVRNGIFINLIWGLVNFVPVFPLDGGQIFMEIVRWKFPHKDDVFGYTVSMVVGIVAAVASLAAGFFVGFRTCLWPALLFGSLAYQNFKLRKFAIMSGGHFEEEAPRQAWEQDADWWKGGGEQQDSDWWKK